MIANLSSNFLFWILMLSCSYFVIKCYVDTNNLYQFPALFSISTLIFIIPTLYFIKNNYNLLIEEDYNRYTINAIVCFWCGIFGYLWSYNRILINKGIRYKYNLNKMIYILAIFVITGGIASTQINATEFGNESTGGIFAITLYFARLLRPSAIVLLTLYLLKPKKITLILFCVWLVFSIKFIFISGRRSEFFILILTFIMPFFFIKNLKVPRSLLLPGAILAIIVVIIFPVIRPYTKKGDYSQISNISLGPLINEYLNGQKTNEVIHAALNMAAVEKAGSYNYGSSFINGLVSQYVSSTLFGQLSKEKFLIKSVNLANLRQQSRNINDDKGYLYYLTLTGYGSSFIEFGYLGGILYFFFAYICAILYKKAKFKIGIEAKVLYSMFTVMIVFSVYDSLASVIVYFVPYLFIYFSVFSFTRIKKYSYSKTHFHQEILH